MLCNNINKEGFDIYFLGSFYGFHDGYDGSCFAKGGLAPSLGASPGRTIYVIDVVKEEYYKCNEN